MPTPYEDAIDLFVQGRAETGQNPDNKITLFREFIGWLQDPDAATADGAFRPGTANRSIAISVQFATSLVGMDWLHGGSWPNSVEWQQILRLFMGLFVILLGWDWYHRDLVIHPRAGIFRFLVDVAVVSTSLMFLASSKNERTWIALLAGIFWLYVVWDGINIYQYPAQFDLPRLADLISYPSRTYREYYDGTRDSSRICGPVTNLCWALYFALLAGLDWAIECRLRAAELSCPSLLLVMRLGLARRQ